MDATIGAGTTFLSWAPDVTQSIHNYNKYYLSSNKETPKTKKKTVILRRVELF
jgi:hypothetical protein